MWSHGFVHTVEWIMYWKLILKKEERGKKVWMICSVLEVEPNILIFNFAKYRGFLPSSSECSRLREKERKMDNKDRLLVAFNFYESGKRSTKNGCSRQGMWHYVSHFMACLSPASFFFSLISPYNITPLLINHFTIH